MTWPVMLSSTPLHLCPSDSGREIVLHVECTATQLKTINTFSIPSKVRQHQENTRTFPYCCLQGDRSHRDSPRPFPTSSSTRNDWLQPQSQCCRTGPRPLLVHTSGSSCPHGYLCKKHTWLQLHTMIQANNSRHSSVILTWKEEFSNIVLSKSLALQEHG